jgi:hypothetical protein
VKYEPQYERSCASVYLMPVLRLLYRVWATDVMLDFFQDGRFEWRSPLGGKVSYRHPRPPGLDFIGLNYYGT